MPKRTDIQTILIIGSGPIVIGQGCEFDYSGTQACKALRAEGYRVVLVNSNPATIMTDPEFSDRTYIEPITPEAVRKILQKQQDIGDPIHAVLPTLGGQTALNCACKLWDDGILQEFGVEMIGANRTVIHRAEDRQVFKDIVEGLGLKMPKAKTVQTLEEARAFLADIGLPAIIRPAFTLGGTGGGIAYNAEEFDEITARGLRASMIGQVQIDQSVLGWKEYELEVVRDKKDNCIIVCGIENIDPMGVHTGDSITIAPIQTLTDKEYQAMRDASLAIMRAVGVETGGSNVQFAVNPKPEDGKFHMVVVEMNPRVSRSSALASKATGFPIAKIAAKLAIGYTLDELRNDITGTTSACFEPAIDYIVTKIPRWTFEKFPEADETLTTQMKSVGEAMAIGRTFAESFQKAIRSMEVKRFGYGLDRNDKWLMAQRALAGGGTGSLSGGSASGVATKAPDTTTALAGITTADGEALEWPIPDEKISLKLAVPGQARLYYIRYALKLGWTAQRIHEITNIDPWFIDQLARLVEFEDRLLAAKTLEALPREVLAEAKRLGYSDPQLANLYYGAISPDTILTVRAHRKSLGIEPVYKLVDTCAAEFEAVTPYFYSTYETGLSMTAGAEVSRCQGVKGTAEAAPLAPRNLDTLTPPEDEIRITQTPKVIIIGGGPNRIGQGIEFDYCCCHAAFAADELGVESVMINSNPETVSTDYDTSDLLFFEPLTLEDTLNVIERLNGNSLSIPEIVDLSHTTGPKGSSISNEWIRSTRQSLAASSVTDEWAMRTSGSPLEVPTDLFAQLREKCRSHGIHRLAIIGGGASLGQEGESISIEAVDETGRKWHIDLPAGSSPRVSYMAVIPGPAGSWIHDKDDIEPEYCIAVDAWLERRTHFVLGAIVQFGGQTPLNLAHGLQKAGVPIIGTSVDSIDLAEDRNRFDKLLAELGFKKPPSGIARSTEQAVEIASRIGYPVLVRPSYVLGGRGMEICSDERALRHYMTTGLAASDLESAPVLIDRFLSDAVEVDVDVIADYPPTNSPAHLLTSSPPQALVCGVMEHIEEAGIHSGDSCCTIPPYSLSESMVARIEDMGRTLAKALSINGLMNAQLAIKGDDIFVLEVNPRASRTVPFVAKATQMPWARLAAKVMMGKSLAELGAQEVATKNGKPFLPYFSVKEVVFPFSKFPGVDVILGPEMRSTGEVMGADVSFPIAFAKAQLAAGISLPTSGAVFISVRIADRAKVHPVARQLQALGLELFASQGTGEHLRASGIECTVLPKIATGLRGHVLDLMADGKINLIINTPTKTGWKTDEGKIRASAIRLNIPMVTTVTGAAATARAIAALRGTTDGGTAPGGTALQSRASGWTVTAMQDYRDMLPATHPARARPPASEKPVVVKKSSAPAAR
ncbi:MAG TPA: carbamoyl-phosphate synthase large subunit [Phycisphaerales bacterium]|nr:carbamoyl-phosphate synthase large subunit [Phycisphaerales bacterium]